MGLEWWQLFYRSRAEWKRAYETSVAQAFGVPVHSGRFSVEEGIEGWRERRRSFVHRLEFHLPELDWALLDAALKHETPDEGMTVAQGKLGKRLGYSQSTVSRRLAPAVNAGLLKSEIRSRKGRFAVTAGPGRTSNRYRLDTARIALLLKTAKTKAKDVVSSTLRPKGSWGPREWRAWGEKLMAESPDRVRHGLSPPATGSGSVWETGTRIRP
jgi:DNA-binding transcriptional ArsR family regulator